MSVIKIKEQERLLCIAMVKDLLRYELVLREEKRFVFLSQWMRKKPDFGVPEGINSRI